ncbi:MAG: efflux transporter outer membrane subunit [Gammaproteobacteria bacterium]
MMRTRFSLPRLPAGRGRSLLALGLAVACLAGCAVGPKFRNPGPAVPAGWQSPLPHDGEPANLVEWWRQLGDPLLTELVAEADRRNATVEAALAGVRAARANAGLELARLLPAGEGTWEEQRSRSIIGFTEQGPLTGVARTTTRSLDARWEIDLLGGQRRALEAAQRRAFAADSRWHLARTTVAAEVANSYTAYRACTARRALLQSAVTAREATATLVARKAQAGLLAKGEAAQAAAAAADNRAAARAVEAACVRARNALAYLTGLDGAELAKRLTAAAQPETLPVPVATRVDVLPAVLVRQRPDVAAAEAEWAAAVADLGFGIGELLPSVNLLGSVGKSTTAVLGGSFGVDNWRFGPTVSMPVLSVASATAGISSLRAQIAVARARYEDQVRVAIREVEDALATLAAADARDADAAVAAANWTQALQAIEARHRAGLASTLELEQVRLAQLQAADTRIALAQERTTAWVALYKALGGGWSPSEE